MWRSMFSAYVAFQHILGCRNERANSLAEKGAEREIMYLGHIYQSLFSLYLLHIYTYLFSLCICFMIFGMKTSCLSLIKRRANFSHKQLVKTALNPIQNYPWARQALR